MTSALREIRPSANRWKALHLLLQTIERLAQANTVIDLQSGHQRDWLSQAIMFEEELLSLRTQISHEISRLTVEGLQSEHAERVRKGKRR